MARPDWKKLNRKATFKLAHKARSFKIQDDFAKLKQTVDTSLSEAQTKEADTLATFEKLMEAKNEERAAAEYVLLKMEGVNGAKGQTKEESQDEVDASNDLHYGKASIV